MEYDAAPSPAYKLTEQGIVPKTKQPVEKLFDKAHH